MRQKDVLAFTFGAVIGVTAALLLAPESGQSVMNRLVGMIKKQKPTNIPETDTNLYNIAELGEGVEELQKLKAEMS